ncbi:MAG: hypothetical protein IT365_26365 [Candidatus Hydrogenedentes bacterium]|nr:hypothetical protein [Candidatus Hydrogenedentota bacterium]
MFGSGWLVLIVVTTLIGLAVGYVMMNYVRYHQFAQRGRGISRMGWQVRIFVLMFSVIVAGYGLATYTRYRLLVQNGERIMADIQPGTSEEALLTYLEANKEPLGISSWQSTKKGDEQNAPDDVYLYHVWFGGHASLWSLLGQKLYLSIKVDGGKAEVKSIHWGFQ